MYKISLKKASSCRRKYFGEFTAQKIGFPYNREQKFYEGLNGSVDTINREKKSYKGPDGPADTSHKEQKSA
jgi:hypothetical protein